MAISLTELPPLAASKAHPRRRCQWTRTSSALHPRSRSFRSSLGAAEPSIAPDIRGTWFVEPTGDVWCLVCLVCLVRKNDENLKIGGLNGLKQVLGWTLLIEAMVGVGSRNDRTNTSWGIQPRKIGNYINDINCAQKTCIENLGESRTLKLSGCQGRAGNPSAENSWWKKI